MGQRNKGNSRLAIQSEKPANIRINTTSPDHYTETCAQTMEGNKTPVSMFSAQCPPILHPMAKFRQIRNTSSLTQGPLVSLKSRFELHMKKDYLN